MNDLRLWHGGAPGLHVGDLLTGGHERAIRADCPICTARVALDNPAIDPPSVRPDQVYVTTHRLYAKHYASLYGRGDLYRVEPVSEPLRSDEDTIPTWTVEQARVLAVYDRAVLLTMSERRRLFREWGEADREALRGSSR